MNNLFIEKTTHTPEINFNAETGLFKFLGRSLPEDSATFYKVVFDWLNQYLENLAPKTEIKFELDYFNTSSAKAIFTFLVKFDALYKKSHPISIQWFYDEEDEDMRDLGQEYKDLFKMPIQLIKIDNE